MKQKLHRVPVVKVELREDRAVDSDVSYRIYVTDDVKLPAEDAQTRQAGAERQYDQHGHEPVGQTKHLTVC